MDAIFPPGGRPLLTGDGKEFHKAAIDRAHSEYSLIVADGDKVELQPKVKPGYHN